MKSIIVHKEQISYIASKKDVNIVYLINGKFWVCTLGDFMVDLGNGFIQLKLAEKAGDKDE